MSLSMRKLDKLEIMKNKINIGDEATLNKVFTSEDVYHFANISLDNNPIHLDDEYASKTIFKARIVQGILVSGLISAVIANKLPGNGSIYLKQELNFKIPVFIGDEITAKILVTKIHQNKPIYTLSTICTNQNNEIVIDGEAIILLNRKKDI